MSKALEQKIEETDEQLQSRAEEIKEIRKELDAEFLKLLGEKEVSELEVISLFSESVKKKLANHYSDIFPKKCNIFSQREKN